MRAGVWISTLSDSNSGFHFVMSYAWKEHILEEVDEAWEETIRWESNGVRKPDTIILNSGIHAFHGLDPEFRFSQGAPLTVSRQTTADFLHNASKLKQNIIRAQQACVIWKTMNDYGSYTDRYKAIMGRLPPRLESQALAGQTYRRLGTTVNAIFINDVPVMDTRGLTLTNPSMDPFHHPNLQSQLALLAWHTIVLSCHELVKLPLSSSTKMSFGNSAQGTHHMAKGTAHSVLHGTWQRGTGQPSIIPV
jgi:hypothetical protein